MNFNFKVIFIWVLTLSFINTHPEYLIFKKDKDLSIWPISEKEHEFVYDILLKYQWPMSIANPEKEPNIAKYSLAEAGPLEEKFIRSKIQEKFKDLDIVFIPTLVYELFSLAKRELLTNLESSLKNMFTEDGILGNKGFTEYLNSKNATLEGIFEKFRSVNNLEEVKKGHLAINNLLLEFFLKKFNSSYLVMYRKYNKFNALNFGLIIKENIEQIVEQDLPYLSGKKFEYLPKKIIDLRFDVNKWDITIFKNIVLKEYEFHMQNYGLIYRVTDSILPRYVPGKGLVNVLEFTQIYDYNDDFSKPFNKQWGGWDLKPLDYFNELINLKKNKKLSTKQNEDLIFLKKRMSLLFDEPSRSISYGNSIFAGSIADRTACVFYYYTKSKNSYFYQLKINKFAFKKQTLPLGDAYLLFTITPLSNLCSLFAQGEYFHSRSKSYYFKDISKSVKGVDLSSGSSKLSKDNAGYILLPGNPIEMNAKLSDYIANNAIIFRPTDKKEADKLIQGQKDVTALFKAMDVIYKYIKRDEEILK